MIAASDNEFILSRCRPVSPDTMKTVDITIARKTLAPNPQIHPYRISGISTIRMYNAFFFFSFRARNAVTAASIPTCRPDTAKICKMPASLTLCEY